MLPRSNSKKFSSKCKQGERKYPKILFFFVSKTTDFDHLFHSGSYYTVVGEHGPTKKLVASATLFVERKFIHACGAAGHIEDVVVDKSMRGRNLGLKLMEALKFLAQELGCYKLMLDCSKVLAVHASRIEPDADPALNPRITRRFTSGAVSSSRRCRWSSISLRTRDGAPNCDPIQHIRRSSRRRRSATKTACK